MSSRWTEPELRARTMVLPFAKIATVFSSRLLVLAKSNRAKGDPKKILFHMFSNDMSVYVYFRKNGDLLKKQSASYELFFHNWLQI
jgi:hypothetical protein